MRSFMPKITCVVHRVSSSISSPVNPSFRAISGRLKFTVRRQKFNEYTLSLEMQGLANVERKQTT
jgi:hypothetical protein